MATASLLTLSGCVKTKAGSFKRSALFGNLEFESATAEVFDYDTKGQTNHYERWEVKGLKSDTQKALQTLEKGLDVMKEMSSKVP